MFSSIYTSFVLEYMEVGAFANQTLVSAVVFFFLMKREVESEIGVIAEIQVLKRELEQKFNS